MIPFKQFIEEGIRDFDPAEWMEKNVTDEKIGKVFKGGWKKLTGLVKEKPKPKPKPEPKKRKHPEISSKDYLNALISQRKKNKVHK